MSAKYVINQIHRFNFLAVNDFRVNLRSLYVGMAEQLQGAESVRLLPGQRLRKGVMVSSTEDGLVVDLHVVLENGVNMKSVCANLTSSVSFTLAEIAQIDPAHLKIAIHVDALKSRG